MILIAAKEAAINQMANRTSKTRLETFLNIANAPSIVDLKNPLFIPGNEKTGFQASTRLLRIDIKKGGIGNQFSFFNIRKL